VQPLDVVPDIEETSELAGEGGQPVVQVAQRTAELLGIVALA
jgi:hypothetical protein